MPLNKALIPRPVSTYWRFLTGSLFIPTNCLPLPHPNSLFSGSAFGRFSAGWLSDSFGRFNTMVITTAFAVTVVYGTWLPISFTYRLCTSFPQSLGLALEALSVLHLYVSGSCARQMTMEDTMVQRTLWCHLRTLLSTWISFLKYEIIHSFCLW
jgi:hypothetical protein